MDFYSVTTILAINKKYNDDYLFFANFMPPPIPPPLNVDVR